MYRFAFLILSMATPSVQAREPDYRSYFTYPDAQLTVIFGHSYGDGHAEALPFENHSIPKTSVEIPVFQGGYGESGPDYDNTVQWRFIQKTESGDMYLLSIYRKGHLIKEVPFLYTGSTVVAYDENKLKVLFEPTESAKWKAP
jgi:hypothetical protein